MEINASKTVYQFLSMRHKNNNFDLKINSQKLPKSENTKYLGVHTDNKLSWKNHVEHTINKVNQRLRFIKRLAGATWGSTQDTMNTTYKTYVKPVMKYGNEILVTASNSTLKALETAQNSALRLRTGGVKTTPTLALQLYTGHLPITYEIKQAAVSLTKIKALVQTSWATKTLDLHHLKTQLLPSNAVNSYLNQLQIPTEAEPICPTTASTEYQSFHAKLSLLSEVKKHDTPTIALQQLALATINGRYPSEEYLRIYTDGSLSKIGGKAGAGIHSELFSHYISVGSNRTSFDGEITAITMALQQLLLRPTAFTKVVLLVDSKSAIQSVASNKQATTQIVKEARRATKLLNRQGKTTAFQ